MASKLPVYSAREVHCAWGIVKMEGFSDDNIVTIAYNSDMTTEKVGCDGKLAISVTPDRTGTVKIELMQTSETTRILSAILAAQNNSGDTSKIVRAAFAIADKSGSVLCTAQDCYIKTAPEVVLGVEQNTHEWTFYSSKIDFLPMPSGVRNATDEARFATIVSGMVALSGATDKLNLPTI